MPPLKTRVLQDRKSSGHFTCLMSFAVKSAKGLQAIRLVKVMSPRKIFASARYYGFYSSFLRPVLRLPTPTADKSMSTPQLILGPNLGHGIIRKHQREVVRIRMFKAAQAPASKNEKSRSKETATMRCMCQGCQIAPSAVRRSRQSSRRANTPFTQSH